MGTKYTYCPPLNSVLEQSDIEKLSHCLVNINEWHVHNITLTLDSDIYTLRHLESNLFYQYTKKLNS